jgi:hypothetical protein
MAGILSLLRITGVIRWVILLVAIHSCVLGSFLLVAPKFVSSIFGFETAENPFFASQAGLFLLILGVCYLLALKIPDLILVILISKGAAVLFLVFQALFLNAPPLTWAAAAADATMLGGLILALRSGSE